MKVPTVIIKFRAMPDLVIEEAVYKSYGGFFKFLSAHSINSKDVLGVEHKLMEESDYPTNAWEG